MSNGLAYQARLSSHSQLSTAAAVWLSLSLSFSVVLSTDRYQLVATAAADAAVVGLFLQFKCHIAASAHMLPQRGKS